MYELFENITTCENILSVHLSDNELLTLSDKDGNAEHENEELDNFEEIIGAFGLRYRDVFPPEINQKPKGPARA